MASSSHSTLFFSLILFTLLFKTSSYPHALLLPVQKDPSTLLYTIQLYQSVHKVPENLTLDLGGKLLWEQCTQKYASATQKQVRCSKNSCMVRPENTVTGVSTKHMLPLGSDDVSIQSTDGINPRSNVSTPRFLFVCAPSNLLKGLPSGVKGMAGLGRTQTSLPSQFSSRFNFKNIFAICLTGATGTGVVFFGPGPYYLLPNYISPGLIYTPLLNPASTAAPHSKPASSSDYFIGVNSISPLPIDASLLAIDGDGNGGTKISTVTPYTVLQTSIFNALTQYFQSEFIEFGRRDYFFEVPKTVASVAPFGWCFQSNSISLTQIEGLNVPILEVWLQDADNSWPIFAANSLVKVRYDNIYCLAFVDGGMNPKTSIVIGAHQLEDNLLQFDLGASMLGISQTLLGLKTTCANFNFTSIA